MIRTSGVTTLNTSAISRNTSSCITCPTQIHISTQVGHAPYTPDNCVGMHFHQTTPNITCTQSWNESLPMKSLWKHPLQRMLSRSVLRLSHCHELYTESNRPNHIVVQGFATLVLASTTEFIDIGECSLTNL
jgi:hypothetical protein